MSSNNALLCRIRIDDHFLKDFKATTNEHVIVSTSEASEASVLPEVYAVAIASFIRALGINATLDPQP
jgi:hypothetical protein